MRYQLSPPSDLYGGKVLLLRSESNLSISLLPSCIQYEREGSIDVSGLRFSRPGIFIFSTFPRSTILICIFHAWEIYEIFLIIFRTLSKFRRLITSIFSIFERHDRCWQISKGKKKKVRVWSMKRRRLYTYISPNQRRPAVEQWCARPVEFYSYITPGPRHWLKALNEIIHDTLISLHVGVSQRRRRV